MYPIERGDNLLLSLCVYNLNGILNIEGGIAS